MRNVECGSIVLPAGKMMGVFEAPTRLHPETSTGLFVMFASSIHSSDVESEDPAHAISEITMLGGVDAFANVGTDPNKIANKANRKIRFCFIGSE